MSLTISDKALAATVAGTNNILKIFSEWQRLDGQISAQYELIEQFLDSLDAEFIQKLRGTTHVERDTEQIMVQAWRVENNQFIRETVFDNGVEKPKLAPIHVAFEFRFGLLCRMIRALEWPDDLRKIFDFWMDKIEDLQWSDVEANEMIRVDAMLLYYKQIKRIYRQLMQRTSISQTQQRKDMLSMAHRAGINTMRVIEASGVEEGAYMHPSTIQTFAKKFKSVFTRKSEDKTL